MAQAKADERFGIAVTGENDLGGGETTVAFFLPAPIEVLLHFSHIVPASCFYYSALFLGWLMMTGAKLIP